MAYRKEYRMLTENERLRYHNALNTLKRRGEYDRISMEHRLVRYNFFNNSKDNWMKMKLHFKKKGSI